VIVERGDGANLMVVEAVSADPTAVEAAREVPLWTQWHQGVGGKYWQPVGVKSKSSG
jgi:hypothetical protein